MIKNKEMMFAKVSETENDEIIEIPIEPQGYILMSTLTAQFPAACGLKFKTNEQLWRGVRVVDDKLYPPDDKWESNVYIITYPKDSKRKGDDLDANSAKSRKIERKCVDLIVLGVPWKSTDEIVRKYFEQYGEVVLCEIKHDAQGNSKGFGFVRFKEYNNQCAVLGKKHLIDGRWCDVKIPNSQEPETSRKIFVGRLSETINTKDLQEYFAQFGQVIDVYIPKPFRAFGFVTFVDADVAQTLCGESHIIKGISVHVSRADPKEDMDNRVGGSSVGPSYYNRQDMIPSMNGGGRRSFGSNSPSTLSLGQSSKYGGSSMRSARSKYDSMSSIEIYDQHRHHHQHHYNDRTHHHRIAPHPSPAPPPPHQPQSSSSSTSHVGPNGDQMNAMMNMFNPMMTAFIQQLANGIQPPGSQGSQSPSHAHHASVPQPWSTPNQHDYTNQRNTSGPVPPPSVSSSHQSSYAFGFPSNGTPPHQSQTQQQQSSVQQHSQRYKSSDKF